MSTQAQPYGLETRPVVGAFLDGALPEGVRTSTNWMVVDAFPHLKFTNLTALVAEPGTDRLLVLEREGRVHVFRNDPATTNTTLFLDLSTNTLVVEDSGLLGLAFHPEYGLPGSSNRNFLYLWYNFVPAPVANPQFTTVSYNRLSRFTVPDGAEVADRASELVLINQLDRHTWHNGGGMFFGPDGFLYVSNGDGGGANDEYGLSQKLDGGLFGGVLRIDVDRDPATSHPIRRQPQSPVAPPSGWPGSYTAHYFIPNDNPWVNTNGTVLEEFYCLGLRSPHRLTYDAVTDRIWCGDIGQNTREEVDVIVKGGNYQWAWREGSIVGPRPQPNPLIGISTPPVHDYGRSEGNSVIGGYVYRGGLFPELHGKYLFGDNGSGKIWAMDYNGVNPPTITYLANMPAGELYTGLSSFGLDHSGEVYLCKMGTNEKIYKLVPAGGAGATPPALLSQTGIFTNLLTLAPAASLIPYDIASPLWSDGAAKYRWLVVPTDGLPYGAGETIGFAAQGNWTWPTGTVLIKHFDLLLNETNAAARKRLETRLLARSTNGAWYGLTYKWRPDHSDADLLAGSLEEACVITNLSGLRTQVWYYPSRSDCMACHTVNSGQVLGPRTCQMNRDLSYPSTGQTDNQLRALNHIGLFSGFPGESNLTTLPQAVPLNHPTAALEDKVRSYLDSNCAHCHRPNGVRAGFDLRFDTALTQQNLINGLVENPLGVVGARVVKPQSVSQSMMHLRVAASSPAVQMPPLARNVVDTDFVTILETWINSLPVTPDLPDGIVGTMGHTGTGTQSDTLWDNGDYINASRFPASSNLTAAFVRAQVVGITGRYKCAVYADNNGSPSILLGSTVAVTNPATGWQTFPLLAPVPMVAGSNYWLAIWSDASTARVYYSGTTGTLKWRQEDFGSTGDWPTSLLTTGAGNYRYCIQATSGAAPAFATTPPHFTVNELTMLVVTNRATDADIPAQALTYYLLHPPSNAVISAEGVITWTPGEAQGPSTNVLTTAVTDGVLSRSNSFTVTVLEVNQPPTANADHVVRFMTQGVRTPVATLLTNDTDSDGDALTFAGVLSPTAQGASVTTSNDGVRYQPLFGNTNADVFHYVIADGLGLTATGMVNVTVAVDPEVIEVLVATKDEEDVTLSFTGVPGFHYTIQATDSLHPPAWENLGVVTADEAGQAGFVDADAGTETLRFYRAVRGVVP